MGYAAVQFDSDDIKYNLEENELFVVRINIDGELCKYVTAAQSRMDAIENVERELDLTTDPCWKIFGPVMVY